MPARRALPASWLLLSLLLAACGAPSPETQGPEAPVYPALDLPAQPNIVWLVAEDLSPYLPAFGDSTVETPHLSRLAREGVRYTHLYSVSGVCAPSRFALATGLYPTSAGAHHMRVQYNAAYLEGLGLQLYEVVTPPEARMMSEVLRRHGYYATNNSKQDHQFAPPVTAWDASSDTAHWRGRAPGQPFFAMFTFTTTHESQIWQRAGDSLWVEEALDVPVPPYLPDTEPVRRDLRRMYSNIKEMDQQVGDVLAQLEADGLLDSTIVVWFSDHGGPLLRQKRLLYDSGLHVPMLIRFPNAQHAGAVDDQLLSFIDLPATAISLAGIPLPASLEGRAFLGPSRAAAPRQYVHAAADRFDEYYDMIRAVRDERFKYLRNFRPAQGYYLPVRYREQMATMQELLRLRDAGRLDLVQRQWFRPSKPEEELFDTWNDPHELHNLAGDPAYADKLAELRAECDRWMEATDDKGRRTEADLIEHFWPRRQQPATAPPVAERSGDRVTLTSATEGASIGYQVLPEGQAPGQHWQVYTAPVPIAPGQHLVALAHRIGFAPSDTVEVR